MQNNNNFKYIATIDWLEFEIRTLNDSNFFSIKSLFKANYVVPINEKSGGATNRFRFRLQNIKTWYELNETFKTANYIQPIVSIFIVGVEISFDAFSISQDKEELIEKAAELFWLLQTPCSKNMRASGDYKGSSEQLTNHKSTIRKIRDGKSIYIGSQKDDEISQRIYYKTTDNSKALPIKEHRARYEITLLNDKCPFHTLEEASSYKFSDLANKFKFRKVKENSSILDLLLTNATKQLGNINIPRFSGGGLKVGNYGTKSNIELNRIAYNKLRELTKRLQKKRLTRKLRVINS